MFIIFFAILQKKFYQFHSTFNIASGFSALHIAIQHVVYK